MPILRIQGTTEESEITPAPLIRNNQQQFHRTKKIVVDDPARQAKIEIHQARWVVERALNTVQNYLSNKAAKLSLFFCCASNSKREADLYFLSSVANDMNIRLSCAEIVLAREPTRHNEVRDAAQNVEYVIYGSYVYVLRKIKGSYNFYNRLLRRAKDPSESVLYSIVTESLRDKDKKGEFGDDKKYLSCLSSYLAEKVAQDDCKDHFLKQEWFKKVQSQLSDLSKTTEDASTDVDIIGFSDDDQEMLLYK